MFKNLLQICLCLVLWNCSSPVLTGGTGIETTNGISGSVNDSNVLISLYPENYDPVKDTNTIYHDTILNQKVYTLPLPKQGTYHLFKSSLSSPDKNIFQKIIIKPEDSSVTVNLLPVTQSSNIKINTNNNFEDIGGYIYIPGTPIYSHITGEAIKTQTILLKNAPPATYEEIILISPKSSVKKNILNQPITTGSANTTSISQTIYQESTLHIDFSPPSYHSNSHSVSNFIALIRLTEQHLDFSKIKKPNKNILFTNDQNKPIPHQIDYWDSNQEQGNIWVFIDSLDSSKTIAMHYGSQVHHIPQNPFTFSNNDLMSVIHFGEDISINNESFLVDYGSKNYKHKKLASNYTNEMIGKSQYFNGQGDYIQLPPSNQLISNAKPFALSGWFRLDSVDAIPNNHTRILTLYSNTYHPDFVNEERSTLSLLINQNKKLALYTYPADKSHTLDSISFNQWYHFYLKNNVDSCHIFLNDSIVFHSERLEISPGIKPASLGVFSDSLLPSFTGSMDEIRFDTQMRTNNWIRWSYENQKLNSDFIRITKDSNL